MNREIEARLKISAVDRTERAFRSVAGRMRQVERQVDAYNRAERRAAAFSRTEAAASGALLTNARLLGGAAVVAGITQTVRAFSSYEDALVEIRKKGGFTEEQMMRVGEEARALATSGELAVPLEEILGAYERGAAAGLPLDELREFARLSAMAADAFGMSASSVGDAAAGFNTALGVPMSEMEKLFDLINSLADAGIADESGIVDYIDRAGAMSKTFGLTVQETAALGTALANLKVPASQAATAMNSILTKILAPNALSGDAREALGRLVGDFDDLEAAITENADEALVDLLRRLRDLDKVARTEIIADLFGQEHLDVVSQLVEGVEEVERNLAMVSRTDWFGSLSRSYALKLDTMSAKWQVFKNEVGELAIDLGSMGLPAMEAGLVAARGIVRDIDAGLKVFSAKIDMGAFEEAKAAILGVSEDIGALAGMEVDGDGEVVKFFRDLADIANTVNSTIASIKEGIDFISDPFGLDGADAAAGAPPKVTYGNDEAFGLTVGGGVFGVGDHINSAVGKIGDLLDWYDDRHEAAATAESPTWHADAERVNAEILSRRTGGDDRVSDAFALTGESGKTGRLQIAPRIDGNLDGLDVRSDGMPVPHFRDDPGPEAETSDDLDASVDALRLAMERGGITITDAGAQAGSSIEASGAVAGQAFSDAAGAALASDAGTAGAAFGRAAAQAFNAGVRLPNGGLAPARPNADLGRTMPDAGTPGM